MKYILSSRISILFILLIFPVFIGEAQDNKPFRYDDHGIRDPFWPLVTDSGIIVNLEKDFLISDLRLEGTMLGNDGENVAIINGRIVRRNQKIGDFTVLKIDKDIVVLLKEQDTFELRLKKEE